ncbi:MAG: hypothetical protein J6J36_00870 [Clostridia bacterium]|nr:hypothetical protein [Clostridia bacterium]
MKTIDKYNLYEKLIEFTDDDKIDWEAPFSYINSQNLNRINKQTLKVLNVLNEQTRDNIINLLTELGKSVIPFKAKKIINDGKNRNIYATYLVSTDFLNFKNSINGGMYKIANRSLESTKLLSTFNDYPEQVSILPTPSKQYCNKIVYYNNKYKICKITVNAENNATYSWEDYEIGIEPNVKVGGSDSLVSEVYSKLLNVAISGASENKKTTEVVPDSFKSKRIASTEFAQRLKDYLIQKIVAPVYYEKTDNQVNGAWHYTARCWRQGNVVIGTITPSSRHSTILYSRRGDGADTLLNFWATYLSLGSYNNPWPEYLTRKGSYNTLKRNQGNVGCVIKASDSWWNANGGNSETNIAARITSANDVGWSMSGQCIDFFVTPNAYDLYRVVFGYKFYDQNYDILKTRWKITSYNSDFSILPKADTGYSCNIYAGPYSFETFYFGRIIKVGKTNLLAFAYGKHYNAYLGIPTSRNGNTINKGAFGLYRINSDNNSLTAISVGEHLRTFKIKQFNFYEESEEGKTFKENFDILVETGHLFKLINL